MAVKCTNIQTNAHSDIQVFKSKLIYQLKGGKQTMRELSQNIKEKAVRLFLAGLSYDEIADQLDIANLFVRKKFKKGGILERTPPFLGSYC